VNIPESATSIGGVAFLACESLKNVTIPNSVTEIGYSAFQDCSALVSIVIPNSVTAIGLSAFENCSSMASVTLSNAITTIEEKTFAGCNSMESVTIPKGVTTIGYDAFLNCYGLASVTIPTSVTSLAYYAFENCYHISSLSLSGEGEWTGGTILIQRPVNLYINSQVTGVKGMYIKPSHVYCSATIPPACDNNSFSDYSGTLHVPASSVNAYRAADYWKNFSNIIGDAPQLGDVTKDGTIDVSDVTALISLILSNNIESVITSNGDMNGDGALDIVDVTMLISLVLNMP
jgi:hypothetical protein